MDINYQITLILFFAAFLGGISVFMFQFKDEKKFKLLLSFSGSYLFAICVLHLIPEIFAEGNTSAGMFILLGFFLQLLLEFLSGGIEHGHIHNHKTSRKIPIAVMLGLCLHAMVEGMPFGQDFDNESLLKPLLAGIVLHKAPIAFVFMSFIIKGELNIFKSVGLLLLFALMSPLGILMSNLPFINTLSLNQLLAVVVGIFLHVSTTILFESSDNHRFNFYKFIIIIFGAALAFLNF